jgi:hypothetical protein
VETFKFVGEVGASDLVPEVVDGRLARAADPGDETQPGVSESA